jgi:uncharacterized integral membrane protein (TIGR00698 family)
VEALAAPTALVSGIALALTVGNRWPSKTKVLQTYLLQGSVVGLGFGLNLGVLARVGVAGLGQTLMGLSGALGLTWVLAKLFKTDGITSLLIGVGTAICGGSAIAAVAPAVGAKSHQTSVALGIVFLLNGLALLVFPVVGHLVPMQPADFGLWSALAIHDTSSVVGASMQFGPEALAVGTTVKLARALWILPVAAVAARVVKQEGGEAKRSYPWFILLFVGAAALVTVAPSLVEAGRAVASWARWGLVASLFFVGFGVSRDALKQVGARAAALGVTLWLLVAAGTLALIITGVWRSPC